MITVSFLCDHLLDFVFSDSHHDFLIVSLLLGYVFDGMVGIGIFLCPPGGTASQAHLLATSILIKFNPLIIVLLKVNIFVPSSSD